MNDEYPSEESWSEDSNPIEDREYDIIALDCDITVTTTTSVSDLDGDI